MVEGDKLEHLQLLPETKRLLRDVEAQTGHPVAIRSEPAIRERGRAVYVVGYPESTRHLVLYDPQHARFLDHLVAHACGHVLRFAAAPPEGRRVPLLHSEWPSVVVRPMLSTVGQLVRRRVPDEDILDYMRIWYMGTVLELSDLPADMRLERWLWHKYPALHVAQRASLADQALGLVQIAERRVQERTPPAIWLASNAMKYSYLKTIAELLDQPQLLRPFRRTAAERVGEELFQLVARSPYEGLAGDQRLSEEWAWHLGLEGWLEYRRLDALPPAYRHAFG